jgi:hypothetical protein
MLINKEGITFGICLDRLIKDTNVYIRRESWDDDSFVYAIGYGEYSPCTKIAMELTNDKNLVPYAPYLAIHKNNIVEPWSPSNNDIFAKDWKILTHNFLKVRKNKKDPVYYNLDKLKDYILRIDDREELYSIIISNFNFANNMKDWLDKFEIDIIREFAIISSINTTIIHKNEIHNTFVTTIKNTFSIAQIIQIQSTIFNQIYDETYFGNPEFSADQMEEIKKGFTGDNFDKYIVPAYADIRISSENMKEIKRIIPWYSTKTISENGYDIDQIKEIIHGMYIDHIDTSYYDYQEYTSSQMHEIRLALKQKIRKLDLLLDPECPASTMKYIRESLFKAQNENTDDNSK